MALKNFEVQQGLTISMPGGGSVEKIFGSGLPSVDAPIGSMYSDRVSGGQYIKVSAGPGSNKWKLLATAESVTAAIGTWRPERVVLATNEIQGAGVRDIVSNPFSDDQGTPVQIDEYVEGKYILTGISGSPVLLKITSVNFVNATLELAALPLVKDDTFVVEHYLPDSALQEGPAIVNYNGSVMVKIADADWGRADALALAPSYASQTGTITSADTVESAIEKLDGNLGAEIQKTDALLQAVGVNSGDTTLPDLSTYVMPMGTTYDSVLGTSSAADDIGTLNYYVSQTITRVTYVPGQAWTTLLTIPMVGDQVYALKLLLSATPPSNQAPVIALESHAVAVCAGSGNGQNSDVDFNVSSKLKPSTRNGVAIVTDYDVLVRAQMAIGQDALLIQVYPTDAFGGNTLQINFRAFLQCSDFS